MAAKISTNDYLTAIKYRRSVYPLSDKVDVSDDRIVEIIKEVALTSPSSYNTQPGRFTVLLGAPHKKLWDMISEIATPIITQHAGEEMGKAMEGRFQIVLFWEDNTVVKKSGETHQASAHMFPQWSEHADAMAQIQIWTALELEGLGANLQHMSAIPPVEEAIRKEWNISADWSLKANMNFGAPTGDHPARPDKIPVDQTVTVFKS
ncbi:Nitroreductase [Microthyrium microscopicum]|uniref:Nitroreductase n=1 Tax=Microthyrium microscopicum TaxID=703497 RepID=A0A6A6U0V1_9PEZI|nr:Nitroreductase [Microthyrium microscopicum]